MNREIKFRAWDGQEMRYEFSVQSDGSGVNLAGDIMDKWMLMQYTWLKDKNGKEIYEGDILHRHMGVCWEVKMHNSTWEAHPKKETGLYLSSKQFIECEVIGNIYQNPELLKSN